MKGTVQLGKDGIIYTKMVSSDDVEEVRAWADELKKLIKSVSMRYKKKVLVLTDLSDCTVANNIRVQSIVAEMQTEDEPYVEKSAAYTDNFALRHLANIVAKISGRRNFFVFKTKAEAEAWLKKSEKGKGKVEIIKETIHEVYGLLKDNPNKTQEKSLDYVSRLHDYSKMETDEEFEAYTIQQGAVLVAYNYMKQNPSLTEAQLIDYILKHYSSLLSKYSAEE